MLEHVGAVAVELAHRGIQGDMDVLPRLVPRRLDAGREQLQGRLVRGQVGREAALVADRGRKSPRGQLLLERVEDLRPHPEPLGEAGRPGGNDHELLEVHRIVRVGPAVQHVHHRHRQYVGVRSAQEAVEGLAGLLRGGAGHGERDAEDRVGAEARLVRRPVQLDERLVDRPLLGRAGAGQGLGDVLVDVPDRLRDPLAVPRLATVAQLGGLELTGRGARRDRGAPRRAGVERHLHLDRRVAARVEDLARVDALDQGHGAGLCQAATGGQRRTERSASAAWRGS